MPNRYQRYLNGRRDQFEENARREAGADSAKSALVTALAIGGIVGGVAAYKSGTFDPLIKTASKAIGLDEIVRSGRKMSMFNDAYSNALKKTTNGKLSNMLNPDYNKFGQYLKTEMERAREKLANPLRAERSALQADVSNLYGALKDLPRTIAKGMTVDSMVGTMYADKNIPDSIKSVIHSELLKNERPSDFLTSVTPKRIEEILADARSQHMYTGDLTKMSDQIFEHVLSAKKSIKEVSETDPTILAQVDKLKKTMLSDLYEKYGPNSTKQSSFVDGVLSRAGYKRATVRDLLNSNDGEMASLGDSFSQFAKDIQDMEFAGVKAQVEQMHLGGELFMAETGAMLDARYIGSRTRAFANHLATNFQIPLVNLNPLRLSQTVMLNNVKEAERIAYFRKGQYAFGITPTNRFEEDAIFMFGKLRNLNGDLISGDEFTLFPGKYGSVQRMLTNMAGLGQKEGNWLQNALDIGLQSGDSNLERKFSFLTKFKNPNWVPNLLNRMKTGDDLAAAESAFRQITSNLYRNTGSLDYAGAETLFDIFNRLQGQNGITNIGLTVDDVMMSSPDDVINTLRKIATSNTYQSALKNRTLGRDILREWNNYQENPERFMKTFFSSNDPEFPVPGLIDTFMSSKSDILPKTDQIKRLIQQELVQWSVDANELAADSLGMFSEKNAQTIKEMMSLNSLLNNIDSVKLTRSADGTISAGIKERESVLRKFIEGVKTGQGEFGMIEDISKKRFPNWGLGPGEEIPQPFAAQSYIPIRRTKNPAKEIITNINESMKAGKGLGELGNIVNPVGDFFQSLFAGKNSLDKLSTATFFPYYTFHRLNEAISTLGIGLSGKSMGSAASIFSNLMLKRIGAVMLGANILSYMGYELQKSTGIEMDDEIQDMAANMSLDAARFRDALGITNFNKTLGHMLPGYEHLFQNPIGGALKIATAGMIGEDRSYDDLKRYYEKGSDPIRNGRWWTWGSNSPWYGGKIMYYRANAYRRAHADAQFSESMYGSEDEYWANNWMPTPRHPFAPIRHFVTDPNHWQHKHEDDRPYPVMGGGGLGQLQEVPIIGPLYQTTFGRILSPQWKRRDLSRQHENYLRDYNEEIKSQYENSGNALYVTQSGAGRIVNFQPGQGESTSGRMPIDPVRIIDTPLSSDNTENVGDYEAIEASGQGPAARISRRVGQKSFGKRLSRSELTGINEGIVSRLSLGDTAYTSIDRLRNVEARADLLSNIDPTSPGAALRESYYNLTEIAGIYGFAANTIFGQGVTQRPQLAQGYDMTSFATRFWNMNLGGLGGELSEITRRFVPRDPFRNKYNPIRNTMPDWLPFDMRYGDPYAQVADGIERLPGEGYERLNQLHPDMFGRYGAMDRFKILADVAPYSDQYRYYKKIMTIYSQYNQLTDEEKLDIKDIREQVAEKKWKYEFTPYKYKYANINKIRTRITSIIDPTTFMVEGMANPIRLAAIKMPAQSDTSEGAMMARAFLSEHIQSGSEITIGLESDPLARVRDDTMQTMRAVVWHNGKNVNYELSRMESGGKPVVTSNWDDNTATATHALYSDGQISLGRIWETIAHLNTPINTKFLQVQSPLESYKRRQVYGKDFRTWDHPIKGYVTPMIESIGEMNPIVGTVIGGVIGSLFGVKGKGKKTAALIGALIGGGASTFRTVNDIIDSKDNRQWIPSRRVLQNDINEYIDILKYIKYKRLYERTNLLSTMREGTDVEQMTRRNKEQIGLLNKERKRRLEQEKMFLKREVGDAKADQEAIKARLDQINDELNSMESGSRELYSLGPLAQLALEYKGQYEGTLYGADANADIRSIFSGLPKTDRQYFPEFLTASPEEREEILRIIPKNQRRFYQAKWGLRPDSKPSLANYFMSHYLPGPNWEGWKPDVSLEAVKVRMIQREGLDPSDFGFYVNDVEESKMAPEIRDFKKSSMPNNIKELSVVPNILKKVLDGFGVTDIEIKAQTVPLFVRGAPEANIKLNFKKDKSQEYADYLNAYGGN